MVFWSFKLHFQESTVSYVYNNMGHDFKNPRSMVVIFLLLEDLKTTNKKSLCTQIKVKLQFILNCLNMEDQQNFPSIKICNFQYHSINKLLEIHMMKIMKKTL